MPRDPEPSEAEEALYRELVAVLYRYAQEWDITVSEAARATHRAAETVCFIDPPPKG